MRAIDTNVLVRLITREDVGQAVAADAFVRKGAWVPIVALAETIWVLSAVYKRTPPDLANAVRMLLDHQDLTLQHADAVAAALELFHARPALGFSDCLILELARKSGHVPLGTFDRNLARIEGVQQL